MFVYQELSKAAGENRPVRVGLIGAGKFGSMFLSQVPNTPGLEVSVICDLRPDGAKAACLAVGWSEAQISQTYFTDDVAQLLASNKVDVVVEATGNPIVGVSHARACFKAGKLNG